MEACYLSIHSRPLLSDESWATNSKGEWEPLWCPLGEHGEPAGLLCHVEQANFSGPVQLHTEYPLGGAENGARKLTLPESQVLAAIRRDLNILKGRMREAQLT